jgi:photosystem II stability/assembly factor-like uncharacterized protein
VADAHHRPATRALNGKFKITGLQFSSPTTGYVTAGGFPGDGNTLYDWIEHSTDAGRTWTPLPAGKGDAAPASGAQLVWVDANEAWSSVVSYATHSPVPMLYFTTDAAQTWQVEREPFWIDDIAVSHGSSWLATTSPQCQASLCADTIYTADRVGGPLTRLPAQPSTTEAISALVRITPDAAAAVLQRRGTYGLVTTADAGRTWHNRALPCGRHPFGVQPVAAPDGTLYLTCTGPSLSMCMSCGRVTIFRSNDIGASWTRAAARGAGRDLCCVASLTPTSGRQVWLLQELPDGSGALFHSTDRANTFTRVLNARRTGYLGPLAARDDAVWVVADKPTARGYVFVVYRSVDGGKTWQVSPLPPPSNLPQR